MGLSEAMDGIDNVNEAIRNLHETDTADEALGYFRDSHNRLVAALGKLSDADLQKPYSHYQPADPDEKRRMGRGQHVRALRRAHRLDQSGDQRVERRSLSRARPEGRLDCDLRKRQLIAR